MKTANEILDCLDGEMGETHGDLLELATELGFDLSKEADSNRLEKIMAGGEIVRRYNIYGRGLAKACREVPEYAEATFRERNLGSAFYFIYQYQLYKQNKKKSRNREGELMVCLRAANFASSVKFVGELRLG